MEFFNSLVHVAATIVLAVSMWIAALLGSMNTSSVTDLNVRTVTQPPSPAKNSMAVAIVATSSAAATSTQIATLPQKKQVVPSPPVAATSSAPKGQPTKTQPSTQPVTNEMISDVNKLARPSVVNILCNFHSGNTASYISGSGLIIDTRGIILTNAHVAQFFLLQDYPNHGDSPCVIRAGNPAAAAYTAALLYLPPAWIDANASQILSNHALGTGERDYAFLYITGAAPNASPLPSSFPALTLELDSPSKGDQVLLAGYPAGFLDANLLQGSLYVSSAVSKIQELYTFNDQNFIDLVSLGGTVISQSGSSGGAVINILKKAVVGLIATESEGTTTASRDLRAVTIGHLDRSLKNDGKEGLVELLSGDPLKTEQDFNTNVAPALTKKLTAAIAASYK